MEENRLKALERKRKREEARLFEGEEENVKMAKLAEPEDNEEEILDDLNDSDLEAALDEEDL